MSAVGQLSGVTGVGYQGHDVESLVAGLLCDDVSAVIDVRLSPISRKRGFSKRALAQVLAGVGIEYRHCPELGNPKWNRAGFGGDEATLALARARFAKMLGSDQAEAGLAQIAELAAGQRVALLCFEADQRRCHRDLVAAAVADRLGDDHRLG